MENNISDLSIFLAEDEYVDYSSSAIQKKVAELFSGIGIEKNAEKARLAFLYVRDEIPHSFDCSATVIAAKASDVLIHKTGICHAKSNLLAALLRSQGIPTGFCYQHLTLADDESSGYCLHCFNAIYLQDNWIQVDARGNTNGIDAQFSLGEPKLAFANRPQYDEYFIAGIYSHPHHATMAMLEKSKTIQDVMDNIPDQMI